MVAARSPVIPPAPLVHARNLPTLRLLVTSARSNLDIWPDYAFDVPFNGRRVLGVESVPLNDPEAIRHVFVTHAANYGRPPLMARVLRGPLGRGIILSEGAEWRRQRRVLAPTFTPASVSGLIPHFQIAAEALLRRLDGKPEADLSVEFQETALEAALLAMFSLPDSEVRVQLGGFVRQFVAGPGRVSMLDCIAPSETSYPLLLRSRRAFQKIWFAARRRSPSAAISSMRCSPPAIPRRAKAPRARRSAIRQRR
ncbi:MAG TPA: cytochrome P450 [Hyphomicrobiaceae bacterium]|nr:cytochrome P450 [Hyphomicrobiaceae bacterium]